MCSSWYQYAYVTPYWKAGETLSPTTRRGIRQRATTGCRSISTPAASSMPPCTCCTRASSPRRCATWAWCTFDEPMLRLFNQGIILGPDGEQMSKSRGNVVAPDEWVEQIRRRHRARLSDVHRPVGCGRAVELPGHRGRAALPGSRVERGRPSQGSGVRGQESAMRICEAQVRELRRITHRTIQRVTEDIEAFKFNTIIAALMEFNNYLVKAKETAVYGTPAWDEAIDSLLLMMAPEMPHITEELWQRRHGQGKFAGRAQHPRPRPGRPSIPSWPRPTRSRWSCRSTARCAIKHRGAGRHQRRGGARAGAGQPGRPEVDGGQAGAQGDLCRREADQYCCWVEDDGNDDRRARRSSRTVPLLVTRHSSSTRHHQ